MIEEKPIINTVDIGQDRLLDVANIIALARRDLKKPK
jgi:hypothetical protein